MTRYVLAEIVPEEILKELGTSKLTAQLLFNRSITSPKTAEEFLNPDYVKGQHDPFLMAGMQTAVSRILSAINDQEKIVIYSDYDCDGIPGGVVLHDFFKAIGYTNFFNYIPHRHYEGFGLNVEAVEKLINEGAQLIITIDCGTNDFESVEKANALGVDVIITDHHEPGASLPAALAVVNPKIGDTYPFKDLCGSGVVFKLVQGLIVKGNFELKPGWEKWWLDMVGVATIADMVPLLGENRVFAAYGLQVLRKSRRPGLQQLLRKANAVQRFLTEDDIGFTIGPRINAASRMDNPEDAFSLLAEADEGVAGAHVEHLEKLNKERKGLVSSISKELHKRLDELEELPAVLVLGNPEWRPSLVGLAAGKLAELYQRPVFIWGRDGKGIIKGSCRSDGKTSVVELMRATPDSFIEYGGHHFSGGFAVVDEKIHNLSHELNEAWSILGNQVVVEDEKIIDAILPLSMIGNDLVRELNAMSPFGVGNDKPLFKFEKITPISVELFGKGKEHTKLLFETENGRIEAISFFQSPEDFRVIPKKGEELSLLAHVEESFFMGRKQIRLRIVEII